MFACLLIKRKLYEYLDNSLSQIQRIKVKGHLEVCGRCRQELYQLKNILEAASAKKTPEPSAEFWHNFKVDLDRKLNDTLTGTLNTRHNYRLQLKPVFAYALMLVFFVALGSYFYKRPSSYLRLAAENESLESDVEVSDEEVDAPELNQNEDTYIDELNLLYQLDQA